jgi:hypothetical protein
MPEEEQQPKLGQARTVAVDWIDRPKVMTAGKDRHQFWPLIARNQRSSQRQPGGVKARANNFMTLNLDEVKKQLAEQIELANKLWLDSEPQRMAADSAMKPWHETNRRIDGLKGLVSILETEGK